MVNINMGVTGVKHIKKCRRCNVPLVLDKNFTIVNSEHSMYICQLCIPTELKQRRMYVNGKYVPKDHPLFKAGRFKTFEGAAFSALQGYEKSNEGYVYVITNPCWKGWIKVGMAIDAEDRCKQYQTSSPFRDYALKFKKYFDNRRSAEQQAHKKIKNICKDNNGEWFKVSISEAKQIIQSI
jgi:hypothetical protein